MKKPKLGVWGASAVLIVAVVFFVYSFSYPYTSEVGPGPGFFPIWLSGLLVVLSLVYLYQSLKGNDSSEEMPDKKGMKNILFIIISMILYVALLPLLGFIVCSALFLFALLLDAYAWKVALATSLGTSVLLYSLFVFFLGVQLPRNALGF